MEDGRKLVTVHIASSWLMERAERDGRGTSNLALLFNFYRDEIEAAASAKYDRCRDFSAEVVVVPSDLPPPFHPALPLASASSISTFFRSRYSKFRKPVSTLHLLESAVPCLEIAG